MVTVMGTRDRHHLGTIVQETVPVGLMLYAEPGENATLCGKSRDGMVDSSMIGNFCQACLDIVANFSEREQ